MKISSVRALCSGAIVLYLFGFPISNVVAQEGPPTLPEPDATHQNLFYGAVPADVGHNAPVLVFVHGLGGVAAHWWVKNDMYEQAYQSGYRTAFISLSPDNTPNNASILDNLAVLTKLLPEVATHYQVEKMYMVGHSKGGVDVQASMFDPGVAELVKAVFTISTPNQGTELSDWMLTRPDIAALLGLDTPAVAAMNTFSMGLFRETADPVLNAMGIPFYTISGSDSTGNAFTELSGLILKLLVPGVNADNRNDGFVRVARSKLPQEYAADLGAIATHHFDTDTGSQSFHRISARIHAMETSFDEFEKIAKNGFSSRFNGAVDDQIVGDESNEWAWSMKWFKGKLYVGTGRHIFCLSFLSSDVGLGTNSYPIMVMSGQCPELDVLRESIGAEIWQYTPDTGEWKLVFKSPNDVPVKDETGNIVGLSAPDVGFRGMVVFTEADGTEALYVGSVTSGSVYEPRNPFQPYGWPAPRILRSVDGENWEPLPQDPGTFLGEVGNKFLDPETKTRSFRSMTVYKGKLFATLADFIGSGVVIASDNPSAGNDAWYQVSPERGDLPVWRLHAFNDYLYATTGFAEIQDESKKGYGVYKTDAVGDPPYDWVPIVTGGGEQTNPLVRSPNGLSMAEFKGALYVGTNRPTELIRVHPDDSWDLIVGEPRDTSQGHKAPLSGFGNGFGNRFNGHFWRMAVFDEQLYLGTWDYSILFQEAPQLAAEQDKLYAANYGFNLYRSGDGIHWTSISQTGLGDPHNVGVRSLESTPVGLFLGTARQTGGLEIFQSQGMRSTDLLAPSETLDAQSASVSTTDAVLNWEATPGAARYRVYRATVLPVATVPATADVTTSTQKMVNVLSSACNESEESVVATVPCPIFEDLNVSVEATASAPAQPAAEVDFSAVFPQRYELAGIVNGTNYSELAPSPFVPSIYYVQAEDNQGNLSKPSNIVAAPSKALPQQQGMIPGDIDMDGDVDRDDLNILLSEQNISEEQSSCGAPCDIDGDGVINGLDARQLVVLCTRPQCATE